MNERDLSKRDTATVLGEGKPKRKQAAKRRAAVRTRADLPQLQTLAQQLRRDTQEIYDELLYAFASGSREEALVNLANAREHSARLDQQLAKLFG